MKRRFTASVLLFLLLSAASGKIRFSGPDLSEDNRLLLKADSSGGGAEPQGTLLCAVPADRSVTQLTAFPENMELLEGGKTLLIRNAFGSQRISIDGGLPRSFPGFPSFTGGSGAGSRVESTAPSPDGRWLLYVEPASYARGTLTLLDGSSGKKISVSPGTERPGRFFPALWSADSRGFIYAKGGRLYFYTVTTRSAPPDERYRLVGEGAINSIYWGTGGSFYYLRGSAVYRVRSDELFARTLYRGFLDPGTIAGKIPFEFDPNFDRFWIAPDGLSLLLCKEGRNLFYYPLGIDEDTETDYAVLPYVMTSRSSAGINVLWSGGGIVTVLISAPAGTSNAAGTASPSIAYRLTVIPNAVSGGSGSFEMLQSPPSISAELSPDGSRAVFWGKSGLWIYDYRTWKVEETPVSGPVYSCIWLGNDELIAGGAERIERIRIHAGGAERKLLCLASASRYGFEQNPSGEARRILALAGDTWYMTDGAAPWVPYRTPHLREPSLVSARYRVYLERNDGGFFENSPMVRNLLSVGTFPLFEPEAPPPAREPVPGNKIPGRLPPQPEYLFSHGTREARDVALAFDLYDDAAGLTTVLAVLDRYGIRATFFLNGEFIRRHPQAAREIADSGHETASMFFAVMDLSDSRYQVDTSFVARGLARNEDEFFKATGRELSLFWHPPYYAVSREIAAAAAAAGYRTTGRDIDSRDWIRPDDAKRLGLEQLSAADLIDGIMDAKEGGSVISIRLGLLPGGRADYLFNSLEVLLDALIREGNEILPVSALMNRSL
ncbi:MAG: polysaccharide deacetylase family protein [Treponema sp.]|jgi:peptidoglycan/xylan/chitin deacetylase (PgdA/CDA1 family)|nr:polysaccharide deacetylase family protein [Treponema sp.]